MKDTFTKEEVAQFVESIRVKLTTKAREESAMADSYLDDPSDAGLMHYWKYIGITIGLNKALGIINKEKTA